MWSKSYRLRLAAATAANDDDGGAVDSLVVVVAVNVWKTDEFLHIEQILLSTSLGDSVPSI